MKSRISVPRLALRWATAAIIIVALAVTSALVANRTLFSAEHAVESLHKHLLAGEGAEALGLMGAQVPQGDAVALDGEVLKRTQAGITEFDAQKADSSENDPDLHTVTAKYKADGVEQESTYTLRRTGKSWLFFDQWSFEPVMLPTVRVKANTVNEVAVNDQKIPLVKGGEHPAGVLPLDYRRELQHQELRGRHPWSRGDRSCQGTGGNFLEDAADQGIYCSGQLQGTHLPQ
ncbi:hypothetical protein ACT3UD_05275 [Glutamicibacter sp. 287]|uniref:hypothetical protein n=1 Tax=Glutamicibacter sp. 287 TaxID=3457732 RepID=UPI004033C91D